MINKPYNPPKDPMSTKNNKSKAFFMCLFPLIFFAYQFILRLWPGLTMQPIMEQFSIDAGQFGLFAAAYYYGYAGFQIPIAIFLDRLGTRPIIAACALLCGLATLLFTVTDNWYMACLSRFLVGAGSAAGFLGVSQVVSEWFPKEHYTKIIGWSFTIGLLGAIYGGKPINLFIEHYDWESVSSMLALVAIIIGFLTLLFLRSPKEKHARSTKDSPFKLQACKKLLSSPTIWLLAIANLLMVGALEGFADVWGIPYFMMAHSIPKSEAAQLVSFVYFGMLFGGPILAFLSQKYGNYIMISVCGLGMAFAFVCLLLSSEYHFTGIAITLFIVGVLCCYQVLVFSTGSMLVSPHDLGVTIAFLNCINMLGGSFFHTFVGQIMDLFWQEESLYNGLKVYDLSTYKNALMLIPISAIVGVLLIVILQQKTKRKS
jgi:MFS family permease